MDLMLYILFFLLTLILYFLTTKKSPKRLPPGSYGFPLIGQSLSLLRALNTDTAGLWLLERSRKYGPVSKMSIFGCPTVFIPGQAATKFIYKSSCLSSETPTSARKILGDKNIFELSGLEHRRIRGAVLSFLKPDVLKLCVGSMDKEIKTQFKSHWRGTQKIQTMQFMKTLTFNMMGSFIVGIEEGPRRDRLYQQFHHLLDGLLALPVNLPFTNFNRSLKSRSNIKSIVMELIEEKRAALELGLASPQQDLLSCLISLPNEEGSPMLSDEEIVDNVVLAMVAGHDTSSILLTFLIRLLASDASIYARVLQEQEEIANSKVPGELLTWDDLKRMSYSWSVALETLRMHPPAFFTFRKVIKDFDYGGYLIPKGWQIIMTPYATHMDDNIFPNASKFDPGHFENQDSVPPYSFLPFGGGPRLCPGSEFTRIETLITLHNLVTQFTWKILSPDVSFGRYPMPTFKNGLEILIEPKISS